MPPVLGQRRGRKAAPRGENQRTIFFASDLHGSEVCFKKFVAAAKFYGADTLLLGGDISAKIVVPVVRAGSGTYRAEFHGQQERIDESAGQEFEDRAGDSGVATGGGHKQSRRTQRPRFSW